MTFELGRSLLLSGVVSHEKLSKALLAAVRQGVPLARALIAVGAIDEPGLEEELARIEAPCVDDVVLAPLLVEQLPSGLCQRLIAAPHRLDPSTGTVEVAVLDPRDTHVAAEIGFHLKRAVRLLRAPYGALRQRLEAHPTGARALAPPMGAGTGGTPPHTRTPLWGTPKLLLGEGEARFDPARRRDSEPPPDMPIPLTRRHDGTAHAPRLGDRDRQDPGRTLTRTWDSTDPHGTDAYGAAGSKEASWNAEPVFELRRLGAPATVRDPEPLTVRVRDRDAPSFVLKAPLPPRIPPVPLRPRVPFAPEAPQPPFADVGAILSGIRAAMDRDAILGLVQLGLRTVARRVAILVVKKEGLAGWSCTPEFGDLGAIRELRIPIQKPSEWTEALGGRAQLGPLPSSVSAPLLRVMHRTTEDVALLTVRVGERPAVLLVADELGDTLLATKRMEELARAAGEALLRILRGKGY